MTPPLRSELRRVPSASRTLGILWRALDLELPHSRRSHGARFFAGFKPLLPSAHVSLLRAMVRTLIDARCLQVRKDARRDPVELIAAALDVGIERWDRTFGASNDPETAAPPRIHSACVDIAVRVAAFELLYRIDLDVDRDARWHAALAAFADVISRCARSEEGELARVFGLVRVQARRVLGSIDSANRDAVLVEIIVLGSTSLATQLVLAAVDRALSGAAAHARLRIGCDSVEQQPSALQFADGIMLVSRGRFAEALDMFEAILDRVPGHQLALEQAARCCFALGDSAAAGNAFAKRASRGGATTRRSGLQRDDRDVRPAQHRERRFS